MSAVPSLTEFEHAAQSLAEVISHTPTLPSRALSDILGAPVLLKMENLQRTGSFKIRGAAYRLSRLSAEERSRGVVAASAGNHAQGVALAAQALGIPATIFMPLGVPVPKLLATRGYGAEVVRAAILSVPQGQWEAAYTVGMNRTRTLTRIVLPQAARVSVPPLSNTFISLVKDTSLASLILVTELFKVAQQIASTTYEFMVLYLAAALVYWVFCLVLSFGQSALERRLDSRVAH